jgi:hypothetical protein
MSPDIFKLIADGSIAAISVGVIAYLFLTLMKQHKEERDEWREQAKEESKETRQALRDLANVIRGINGDS